MATIKPPKGLDSKARMDWYIARRRGEWADVPTMGDYMRQRNAWGREMRATVAMAKSGGFIPEGIPYFDPATPLYGADGQPIGPPVGGTPAQIELARSIPRYESFGSGSGPVPIDRAISVRNDIRGRMEGEDRPRGLTTIDVPVSQMARIPGQDAQFNGTPRSGSGGYRLGPQALDNRETPPDQQTQSRVRNSNAIARNLRSLASRSPRFDLRTPQGRTGAAISLFLVLLFLVFVFVPVAYQGGKATRWQMARGVVAGRLVL